METFLKVEFDVKSAKKDLDEIQLSQFPFAYAKSLTQIAQVAQKMVQERTRKEFKLHGEFIPKGIRIQGANKHDIINYGLAVSRIFTAPIISEWMPLQETGGEKIPSKTAIAIPGKNLAQMAYQMSSGQTKKQFKPSQLLKRYNETKGSNAGVTHKKGGRKAVAFILKNRIVIRASDQRYPLVTLYLFDSKAQIKPRWDFLSTVEKSVSTLFPTIFAQNLILAVESRIVT